jgi:hypothetical protein
MRNKIVVIAFGLVACSALGLLGANWESGAPPKNVVLIGWDGADRRNIKEYWGSGTLPNLERLAAEGAIVSLDATRYTDTKAGWAQILTGYDPEITGVYNNKRYGPIPPGYSIFGRLEERLGREAITTVAVIGKDKHMEADPPVLEKIGRRMAVKIQAAKAAQARQEVVVEDPMQLPKVVQRRGKTFIEKPGGPYYHTRQSMDVFVNGLHLDYRVGRKALELLTRYRDERFFFFVHFAEIDHQGHRFGEGSVQHRRAYRSADDWTGKIMRKLEKLGLYDDTLIYVTSDHGFMKAGRRHWDAPYVFLATNDSGVMRRGDRVDVTPTIMDRFGFDLSSFDPPLDGRSLLHPYTQPIW